MACLGCLPKLFAALAVALLLASCAGTPRIGEHKPVIQSIAIIPVPSPSLYEVENRPMTAAGLFALTALAYRADSIEKSRLLSNALAAMHFAPGDELTLAVAQALRAQGYRVEVLPRIRGLQEDGADMDYGKLGYAADALLHVTFSEVGMHAASPSARFLPRVNASGRVVLRGQLDFVYDRTLFYGADARAGASWGILADERFVYPDFEAVLNHPDAVRSALSAGVREIANRMAVQIHAALD